MATEVPTIDKAKLNDLFMTLQKEGLLNVDCTFDQFHDIVAPSLPSVLVQHSSLAPDIATVAVPEGYRGVICTKCGTLNHIPSSTPIEAMCQVYADEFEC